MSNNTVTEKSNLPPWYKILMTVALVWNIVGVLAFIGQMLITPETLAQMPQAEQELYLNTPVWATVAFAVAVFGGALGCLALLMQKAIANIALQTSLVAVLLQVYHSFFISNAFDVFGPGGIVMPISVVALAVILVLFAKKATKQGWIA